MTLAFSRSLYLCFFWFLGFPLSVFNLLRRLLQVVSVSVSVKWVSFVCCFSFLGAVFRIVFVLVVFILIFLAVLYSVIRRIWEKTRCSTMISLLLLFAFSNTLNIRFETFRMNTFFSYFMLHDLFCFFFSFKEGGLGYNLTLLYRKMPSDFITRVPIKVGRAWEDGRPAHTWIVSLLFGQI